MTAMAPNGHVAWLDGWRGLALLLVLAAHFGGPDALGRFGVSAFFVLSGLLMARLLYVRQQPLPAFFMRRMARIMPAFLVYTVGVYAIEHHAPLSDKSTPADILSTLLFLRTYLPADSARWMTDLPLAHLWSLSVEEHCYIFLAVTAALLSRRTPAGARWILGSALASAAFYGFYRYMPPSTAMPYAARTECAAYALLLSAGIHLATVSGQHQHRQHHGTWALVLLLLGLMLTVCWQDKLVIAYLIAPTLLAIAINLLMLAPPGPLSVLLGWPPLRKVGIASFSLYLWQQPAHFLIQHQVVDWPNWLGLLVSLALGTLSFTCIERPARRWVVRRLESRPALQAC